MVIEQNKLQMAGEKVITGLRDNLLKPMHDSLIIGITQQQKEALEKSTASINSELAEIRKSIDAVPERILQTLIDSLNNIKW